ncbi:MAG: NUDIX domain-containing protein [Saprospiraceae bacterium]
MTNKQQTYEIQMDKRSLILAEESLIPELQADARQLILPYSGNKKSLFQYLDTLEKSDRFQSIVIFSKDLQGLYQDLKSLLLWIPAAGGIIKNKEDQILAIYRRAYWDLPKGKLDANEKFKIAALRECEEETGLKALVLGDKLAETYHIYREKNNARALKKTKWYVLHYFGSEAAIPQSSEGIEQTEWLLPQDALLKKPIHRNIYKLIEKYIQLQTLKTKGDL